MTPAPVDFITVGAPSTTDAPPEGAVVTGAAVVGVVGAGATVVAGATVLPGTVLPGVVLSVGSELVEALVDGCDPPPPAISVLELHPARAATQRAAAAEWRSERWERACMVIPRRVTPAKSGAGGHSCTFAEEISFAAKPATHFRRVPPVEMAARMSDFTATVATTGDDLESLFRAHYARLVRALAVVAGSQEAAADAVQEAFVKAHLHWRRIRRYDDPVGWIRRVAINRLRDDHRRRERKDKAVQRLHHEFRPEAVEWSDGTDVQSLLADLPRQQRLAMALFYVEHLTVAEVAATLDISEGAVKFHLHQGRDRLRGVFTAQQEQQR